MNYPAVPILMYHEVGHSDSPWSITPEQFEAQMKYLREQGYVVISLTELQAGLEQNLPLPQKAVVITFDDGREGVYTHALSILQQYGFTATIYIVPSWVGGQNIPSDESYSEFLTWDQLTQLANAGFEIGSHSFSHKNMSMLDAVRLEQELSEAENVIERQLQRKVKHFAYPYGIYNEQALSAVRSRYATAVSIDRGFLKAAGRFARQWILGDTTLEKFQQLLTPPRLSLAMIVKNEEKNLVQCLESVRTLADEIVIVDTGSKDKTKEIAAQFTHKVFDFSWIDDFAAARNEAMKHATGDWVLILDADEIIAQDDQEKIKEAMNHWEVDGFRIMTQNYTNDSLVSGWKPVTNSDQFAHSFTGWVPSLKVRLFQRKESIQFKGRIHEMVDEQIIREQGTIAVLPVVVHHHGYCGKEILEGKNVSKINYYTQLSQQKTQEEPANAKAYYELGVLYRESGQYADAEKAFQESLRLDNTHVTPLLNLAIVQQKQGKYDGAIENYQIILGRENTISPDAHFGMGFCYFQKNQLERALIHFQQAVRYNPSFVDAYINLGAVWERLGKYTPAIEALSDALALSPNNARAYYNRGVIYEKVGDLAKAMVSYEKAIELNYSRKAELVPKVAKMKEILAESG